MPQESKRLLKAEEESIEYEGMYSLYDPQDGHKRHPFTIMKTLLREAGIEVGDHFLLTLTKVAYSEKTGAFTTGNPIMFHRGSEPDSSGYPETPEGITDGS